MISHTLGARDGQGMADEGEWRFQLGQEDRGPPDFLRSLVDLGGAQRGGGAGHDDDGVLLLLSMDDDGGRACGQISTFLQEPRADPLGLVDAARHGAIMVLPDLGDELHRRAEARGGDCLVGPLAARADAEAAADLGLGPDGNRGRLEDEIDREDSHDDDHDAGLSLS
jgi:hypothetical protein